jgi:hypothetical protein
MRTISWFTRRWEINRLNISSFFRNSFSLFIIISATSLFSSCKKGPEPLSENSVISGTARTYNSSENDTITVVANGPYGSSSQVTSAGGSYTFNGLGNGTYRLDFIKKGYGTIRQYGIQLFGYDTVKAIGVSLFRTYSSYKIPEFKRITFGTKPRAFPEYMCVVLETNQILGYFPMLFFLSTDKNVTYRSFQKCSGDYWVYGPYETIKEDKIYIELQSLPFASGSEVFIIGYVCNQDEYYYGYFDRYLGYEEWSTLESNKHTPVMSFIMP